MTTKTKINKKMKNKTNPTVAQAIFLAKKNNMIKLATLLSRSSKRRVEINLDKIESCKKETVIVPGKVLSLGEIKTKHKVYAMAYSERAKEKLKKAGCEVKMLIDALRENKKLDGEIIE